MPNRNMTTSVALATIMTCLSVALRCSSPRKMFSPMAEAPMIRYEELELIEAAKCRRPPRRT